MEKTRHSHHQYITFGGTPGRPKYATRHLAALDFLQNVLMTREQEIVQAGRLNVMRMQHLDDGEKNTDAVDADSFDENRGYQQYLSTLTQEEMQAYHNELAGKKLLGPHAVVGKVSPSFRYNLQRWTEQCAAVRMWEEQLLNSQQQPQQPQPASSSSAVGIKPSPEPSLFTSRVYFSRARSYPVLVSSFIKYDASEERAKHEKMKADDKRGMEVFLIPERDWRGHSFKEIINKQQPQLHEEHLSGMLYDPDSLDDPKLIFGTNKLDMKTSIQTGPILSSIITYVNAKDLKKELNEKFREMHPALPPSLTLSKIRNVKKRALFFGYKLGLELSTLAMAFICFERLCLMANVTKFNRKLSMAVCLLLAYKFNESTVGGYRKVLDQLLDFCDNEWDLPRNQIFEAELGAFAMLNFLLHLPYRHVHVVYTRLLKMLNLSSHGYLGEDMQGLYLADAMAVEKHAEEMRQQEEEREMLALRRAELEQQQQQQEEEEEKKREKEKGKEKEKEKGGEREGEKRALDGKGSDSSRTVTPLPIEVDTAITIDTTEKVLNRPPSKLFGLFDKRSSSRNFSSGSGEEYHATPTAAEHADENAKYGRLGRHTLFGGSLFRRKPSTPGGEGNKTDTRLVTSVRSEGYSLHVNHEEVNESDAEGKAVEEVVTPLLVGLERTDTLIDDPEGVNSS